MTSVPGRINIHGSDLGFIARLQANIAEIEKLYHLIYESHPAAALNFDRLLDCLMNAYAERPAVFRKKDDSKLSENKWFLSNKLCGMSLYVDRFAGTLKNMPDKLPYLEDLGVNLLHLMPVFESPANASDGGYAVSDFRKIDERFGTLDQLTALRTKMNDRNMYLMLDIVLNHTSEQHMWAQRAREGDPEYQDYYYFFNDRSIPDAYDQSMPEIFPESSPGNFTHLPEINQWVMTVFHHYQWDLNYTNPRVLVSMLENVLFYANLGVDILRIDAPAFIWKKTGTTCQNLPEAHTLLQLIKLCVEVCAPGMAILGEAIVAPQEIMKYFGTGVYQAHECDFAYNATQMALQWDALATAKVALMISAQSLLLQKPSGTSWITYTRSHDDIGFGFGDDLIQLAGFNVYAHRKFLKDYLSGNYPGSFASGALFSYNPKTEDARISGTLAALCGLEKALASQEATDIQLAISRILLMQAMSFTIGGIPMLFAGEEQGAVNDYSYLNDLGKSYDNRWMHRPVANWKKNAVKDANIAASVIFSATKKLIRLRKELAMLADVNNIVWLHTENDHVAGYRRALHGETLYCLFNFSPYESSISWWVLNRFATAGTVLKDYWSGGDFTLGADADKLFLQGYQFYLFK